MRTIKKLIEEASIKKNDRAALLAVDGRQVTYQQLLLQLDFTANQLRGLGIGPQDRVAIVLPNGLEMALAFLSVATAATGGAVESSVSAWRIRLLSK